MESRIIERPDVRWRVFRNTYQLMDLQRRIELGSVTAHDVSDLVEIREMLHDDICAEPSGGGFAFFNSEELQAFRDLISQKIDVDFLLDTWKKDIGCLRTPEFAHFLQLAENCMAVMMAVGRGLPGWNQKDPQYGSPLY